MCRDDYNFKKCNSLFLHNTIVTEKYCNNFLTIFVFSVITPYLILINPSKCGSLKSCQYAKFASIYPEENIGYFNVTYFSHLNLAYYKLHPLFTHCR